MIPFKIKQAPPFWQIADVLAGQFEIPCVVALVVVNVVVVVADELISQKEPLKQK